MNARLRSTPGTRSHLRVLILVTLLLGVSSVSGSAASCIEYNDIYGREVVDARCVAAAEEASSWPDHNPNNPEQTQQIAQAPTEIEDDGPVARGSEDPTLVGSDAEREQVARPTDQEVIHTTGIAPR